MARKPTPDPRSNGDSDEEHGPRLTVVGIGASDGGLAALHGFFEEVPADSGVAFVVVLHLVPDYESHLADILQPHVKMPVMQVEESVRLEANHVYLIPPRANLEAVDTHLRLSELECRRENRAPVDHFFRTLAGTHDSSAIGVVLSGTGSDGALGLKAVKEKGGLALVQDPDEAEYDGMPQSAIATGVVDRILPVAEIAGDVLRCARTEPRLSITDQDVEEQGEVHAPLHRGEEEERQSPPPSYGDVHQEMLEQLGPPSLLLGPDGTVVNLSGDVDRFLHHPSGEVTASVFKLVRKELHLELRAAMAEARRTNALVRTRPVLVRFNDETHPVTLRVQPGHGPHLEEFVLVIFEEWEAADGALPSGGGGDGGLRAADDEREDRQEVELNELRQRLQTVIEEYETGQEEMKASNEELQSANEELRSTLEALETSKEELHSMNEELQTVNQENRHKVEELSQLSGDLQNLLTATDIATLFLDRDLRILRFTPQVETLFNVRSTDRGRPLSDLTHRLGYDELTEDASTVLKRLVQVEREVRDHDGRWYLARFLPYRSSDDRIDGVVITFVDITTRKKIEEELRGSEQRVSEDLATMVRLHELVGRLLRSRDLDSALSQVLEAAIAIGGSPLGNIHLFEPVTGELRIAAQRGFPDDFVSRFARVNPGDGTAFRRALESGERVVIEDVETDPDFASYRDAAKAAGFRSLQSTPLIGRSGDFLGVMSTHYAEPGRPSERHLRVLDLYARQAVDVLERVQSDDALRRSEERYRTLFESIDEGFCIIEVLFEEDRPVDYVFLETNPAFSAQTGLEDAVGRRMREIAPTHENHWFEIYGRIARTGRSERFHAPAEALGRHFDVYAFRFGEAVHQRVAVLFKDVTQQRQTEAALRSAKLRQEEFLSMLSHELRNPLAALVQGVALLDAEEGDTEAWQEARGMMERQLGQLVRLVDDLLDIARISQGKIELRRATTDLQTIVDRALETVRGKCSGHRIEVELPHERLELHGDAIRLVQAVANLVHNACKYTPPDGRICIAGWRDGDEVVVSVSDDGAGIAGQQLSSIFEPFVQVDPSGGGLGIGLALVRRLVELHGGAIQGESGGTGHGSVFTIRLPKGFARADDEVRRQPKVAELPAEVRVLVVDDSRDNADSLAALLRVKGAEVRCAYTGADALEVAREWQPSVVLLDLGLPDLTGFEVAERLRVEHGKSTVLIAVTGYGDEQAGESARQAGFVERVVKPVDVGTLLTHITRHLARRDASD